jgi:hypothetical protein
VRGVAAPDGGDGYAGVGEAALTATGAKTVVCVGGGPSTRAEQLRSDPSVEWIVVDVGRPGLNDGDAEERPAITSQSVGGEGATVYRVRGGSGRESSPQPQHAASCPHLTKKCAAAPATQNATIERLARANIHPPQDGRATRRKTKGAEGGSISSIAF